MIEIGTESNHLVTKTFSNDTGSGGKRIVVEESAEGESEFS